MVKNNTNISNNKEKRLFLQAFYIEINNKCLK